MEAQVMAKNENVSTGLALPPRYTSQGVGFPALLVLQNEKLVEEFKKVLREGKHAIADRLQTSERKVDELEKMVAKETESARHTSDTSDTTIAKWWTEKLTVSAPSRPLTLSFLEFTPLPPFLFVFRQTSGTPVLFLPSAAGTMTARCPPPLATAIC